MISKMSRLKKRQVNQIVTKKFRHKKSPTLKVRNSKKYSNKVIITYKISYITLMNNNS